MSLTTCPECNKQVSDQATACPSCGYPMSVRLDAAAAKAAKDGVVTVRKSRGVYIVLGLLFGLLGVHSFYAGYYWQGFFQLLLGVVLWSTYIGPLVVIVWTLASLVTETHDASGVKMA